MTLNLGNAIHEGKSKILFETDHPDGYIVQRFKDAATAFNGLKKSEMQGKGAINNAVSTWIFQHLEKNGVETHFVDQYSECEMLVRRVEIIPVEVIIRNQAAGSICKRLGVQRARKFDPPLVEYFYKDDELGDPLISDTHIFQFHWATAEELEYMKNTALEVNKHLGQVFSEIGLALVDFKLEFGRTPEGKVILADEFTADGCRLWDKETGEPMDKDRFRFDLGKVKEAYLEVHHRLREFFKQQ